MGNLSIWQEKNEKGVIETSLNYEYILLGSP